MERQADEREPLSIMERRCIVDKPIVLYWDSLLEKMARQ